MKPEISLLHLFVLVLNMTDRDSALFQTVRLFKITEKNLNVNFNFFMGGGVT